MSIDQNSSANGAVGGTPVFVDTVREVTFHICDFEGSDQSRILYSERRSVSGTQYVLDVAGEVLLQRGHPNSYIHEHIAANDVFSVLYFRLLKSGITSESHRDVNDEVTIGFGLAEDGGLIFSRGLGEGYPYLSFDNLSELERSGLLAGGRIDQIVVRPIEGRGGDTAFVEIVGWLLDQGVDIGIELTRDFIIFGLISPLFSKVRNGRRDRRARKIAALWAVRNLEAPAQLRNYIDTKDTWTEDEVAKHLRIHRAAARQLLRSLGLEPNSKGVWVAGMSRRAHKRRARWEANEDRAFFRLNGLI